MTFLLLLFLLHHVTSLHVFVSSQSRDLLVKQTFSLVVEGEDCPYDPCYFTVRINKVVVTSGEYENSTKSADITVSTPGHTKLVVVFSDDGTESELVYPATLDGGLPLLFVIPVLVTKSDYCNSMVFSVGGEEVEGVSFSEETLVEINILNGAKEKITSQYFYSGVLSPSVQFTNTTSQLDLPITRNYTAGTWTILLNKDTLLSEAGSSPRDWQIRVTFPNTYVDSCLVQEAVFSVSLLSSVYSKLDNYFDPVTPVLNTESQLLSRYSPCSRNVQIVFQKNSLYFGIYKHGKVEWFTVGDVGGESSELVEAVLLPTTIILVTSRGILTVGESGRREHVHPTTHATLSATRSCPAVCTDRTIITLNQNAALTAEYPYSDWETVAVSPDPDCEILDTYHDTIRNLTVVSQKCGDTVSINGTGSGPPFHNEVSWPDDEAGVHWDEVTSDLYLYGSQILHSSSRGQTLTTVLTLGEGELVRHVVSGGLFGDILALTDSGRVFMSNVGINRFVEVHNIQSRPITPLTYFTLDHTSQLCYHTLRDSSITRYRIPRRALYVAESMSDTQLYIEHVGGNKVRLISFSQKDTFASGDVGKIFQLNEGRGSGRIAEVTRATISEKTSSVAILEVVEPFFKPKPVQNTILIDSHGDDLVKIGLVGGGLWSSRHTGSCILVLHCTPFLVSGVHSPTSLIATPLYPDKASECMGSIASDRWFSINLDPYMSTVEVEIGDKFVVTEVGDQVTMSAPSSLSSDLKGSIITVVGGRQGIVQQVNDVTFVIISNDDFLLNEEFESGEIVFSNIGSGMFAEDTLPRDPSWTLSEPECEVVFVADDLQTLSHPVPQQSVHIDTFNQVELKVKVSDKRMFPPSAPVFKIVFDSRDRFQFYFTHNTTSHLTQLTIGLSHESTVGGTYTPVLITPYLTSSLKCEVPSVLFSIQQACDPQTRLVQRYPHVQDQAAFLSPHFTTPHGDNVMTSLPVNYRPPSIHGREISTSRNVYNVDPSQPISKSVKAVSKNSSQFKQCAGADSRDECSCSDELKISDLAAHSDCKEIVYKVPYTSIFTPELLIMRLGEDPLPLNHTYLITELNGREEFQIYKAGENNLSPGCNYTNCSIVFLGSELFHYRVEVMEDTICNYSTEFLVYVVEVPLPTTLHNTITVHVGAIMFLIILIYYTCSKGADRSLNQKGSKFRDNSSSSSSLPNKTAL